MKRSKENKSNRFTKSGLKKGSKGAISILLCLLMTPFLSIALGLSEYARYQQVMEVTDEVYELTGLSRLADYDKYIHNRFGILATSQTDDTDTVSVLNNNIGILGNQVSLENPRITGQLALNNSEILRQQIVDFSELTATTAILYDDLNLQELLSKLQNLSMFEEVMETVDDFADLTDAVKTAVEKIKELKSSVSDLKRAIEDSIASADSLAGKMADLFTELGENGIMLPQNVSPEQIDAAINSFTEKYLSDFKDLYKTANTLISNLKSIKTKLDAVKTAANGVVDAVNAAKTAMDDISESNSADKDGAVSEAATSTFQSILNDMESLVEDTLSDLSDSTVSTAKSAVNEIINTAIESVGLEGITTRYSEIVNGSYFSLPLTSTAEQDLIDFLKTVQTVYSSHSTDSLKQYFKNKFVPNISSIETIVKDLTTKIPEIIDKATEKITEGAKSKLSDMLTGLVNIVKKLFDFDMFYDADLNAVVTVGAGDSSYFQNFLDSITKITDEINNFTQAAMDFDLFGALEAMANVFSAIGELLKSIFKIVEESIASIGELASSLIRGDVRGLYEQFLISGYMRHNLPSRVNYDNEFADVTKGTVVLEGEGLTGFSYNDIPREDGTKMFKGAELEYIFAGTKSEKSNQTISFLQLFFLRLLLDLPSVFSNSEVRATAIAANVASWVVYILYVIIEPFLDCLILVNGSEVPLLRGSECWLTATGIDGLITRLADATLGEELQSFVNDNGESSGDKNEGSGDKGLNYQSHMLILLMIFVDDDIQIKRLKELINLEASEYYRLQGKSFNMNEAYTAVQISADAIFNPFFDIGTFSGGASFLPRYNIKQTVSY